MKHKELERLLDILEVSNVKPEFCELEYQTINGKTGGEYRSSNKSPIDEARDWAWEIKETVPSPKFFLTIR